MNKPAFKITERLRQHLAAVPLPARPEIAALLESMSTTAASMQCLERFAFHVSQSSPNIMRPFPLIQDFDERERCAILVLCPIDEHHPDGLFAAAGFLSRLLGVLRDQPNPQAIQHLGVLVVVRPTPTPSGTRNRLMRQELRKRLDGFSALAHRMARRARRVLPHVSTHILKDHHFLPELRAAADALGSPDDTSLTLVVVPALSWVHDVENFTKERPKRVLPVALAGPGIRSIDCALATCFPTLLRNPNTCVPDPRILALPAPCSAPPQELPQGVVFFNDVQQQARDAMLMAIYSLLAAAHRHPTRSARLCTNAVDPAVLATAARVAGCRVTLHDELNDKPSPFALNRTGPRVTLRVRTVSFDLVPFATLLRHPATHSVHTTSSEQLMLAAALGNPRLRVFHAFDTSEVTLVGAMAVADPSVLYWTDAHDPNITRALLKVGRPTNPYTICYTHEDQKQAYFAQLQPAQLGNAAGDALHRSRLIDHLADSGRLDWTRKPRAALFQAAKEPARFVLGASTFYDIINVVAKMPPAIATAFENTCVAQVDATDGWGLSCTEDGGVKDVMAIALGVRDVLRDQAREIMGEFQQMAAEIQRMRAEGKEAPAPEPETEPEPEPGPEPEPEPVQEEERIEEEKDEEAKAQPMNLQADEERIAREFCDHIRRIWRENTDFHQSMAFTVNIMPMADVEAK